MDTEKREPYIKKLKVEIMQCRMMRLDKHKTMKNRDKISAADNKKRPNLEGE